MLIVLVWELQVCVRSSMYVCILYIMCLYACSYILLPTSIHLLAYSVFFADVHIRSAGKVLPP